MANPVWVAKITNFGANGDGSSLVVSVAYFLATDTGFTNTLATQDFTVGADTSAADIRTQIISYGNQVRNQQAKLAAAQALIGTTVNVP